MWASTAIQADLERRKQPAAGVKSYAIATPSVAGTEFAQLVVSDFADPAPLGRSVQRLFRNMPLAGAGRSAGAGVPADVVAAALKLLADLDVQVGSPG